MLGQRMIPLWNRKQQSKKLQSVNSFPNLFIFSSNKASIQFLLAFRFTSRQLWFDNFYKISMTLYHFVKSKVEQSLTYCVEFLANLFGYINTHTQLVSHHLHEERKELTSTRVYLILFGCICCCFFSAMVLLICSTKTYNALFGNFIVR